MKIDLNTPLVNSMKSDLMREITIILKSKDKPLLKSEICNGINDLNSGISKRLEQISWGTSLQPKIVKVRLSTPGWPRVDEPKADGLNVSRLFDLISDTSKLRIIINFEDIKGQELNKAFAGKDISHLIEISLVNHAPDDFNHYENPTATVYIEPSVKKIFKIIADVMLDISMYHTIIDKEDNNTVNFKRDFTYSKVVHAKKKNITSKESEWQVDKDKNYISLAGYFWKNDEFDYLSYTNCWLELGNQEPLPCLPIEKQLRQFISEKQISIEAVKKMYEILPKGEYILVRISRKPESWQSKVLGSLFGRSKTIKIGKIKFFPKKEIDKFNELKNCVSIFKVIK